MQDEQTEGTNMMQHVTSSRLQVEPPLPVSVKLFPNHSDTDPTDVTAHLDVQTNMQ